MSEGSVLSKDTASDRVQRLRYRLLEVFPEISSERAVIATEFYQQTEGMPSLLRRAKLLERILTTMTIIIRDDELIVGNHTEKLRAGAIFFPECSAEWIEKDIDNFPTREQDPFLVSEKVRKELLDIVPYWRGKSLSNSISQAVPPEEVLAAKHAVSHVTYSDGTGHVLPDYEKILAKGFKGIIEEIRCKKSSLDTYTAMSYRKKQMLEAMEITVEAIIKFAHRFSEEAKRLAELEEDEVRKKELKRISENCAWVPENPCRGFYEALQAIWFVNLVIQLESNGTGVSIGRLDKIIYPYYKKDIDEGNLSQGEAQELLDSFWLKFEEINKVRNSAIVGIYSGYLTNQAITIGGIDSDGKDITNPVTYMCLEAQKRVHLRSPQLALRVHGRTPYKLLRKAVEVISMGGGLPQLIGDNAIIQSLVRIGLPLEVARDYANIGCVEPGVVGSWGIHKGGALNLPKIADMAISNGIDRFSGVQVGCNSGRPEDILSMEDYISALKKQVKHFVDIATLVSSDVVERYVSEIIPHVFLSTIVPGCIDSAMEVNAGGAKYNWTGVNMAGTANYGNIIAAIKKVVFDDGFCTMSELNDALNKNFEGYGELRYRLQNAPKYGNDDDYVDLLLADVLKDLSNEYGKHSTPRGGTYTIGFFPGTMNHYFGEHSAATADGREKGAPFSDAISPSPGTDRNGPTAILNSVTKIDLSIAGNGAVLNMKFSPQLFNTEEGIRKFIDMNKAYLTLMNGYHAQYNVVSKETLLKAQQNPKAYRDLIIRVTGYSAYFTELGKGVQDQIIARTEQCY